MPGTRFVDTNVLAFAFDARSPPEQGIAHDIIREPAMVLSTQVLSELYVTLTRKLKPQVPAEAAASFIRGLRACRIVPVTGDLVEAAMETCQRYQLSYWDGLIIESTAAVGCDTLLSEDLTHGQVIHGVTIINPFRDEHGN